MSNTALFIRHQAKPGMRDRVREIWEQYVKPRAATSPEHLAYYFCYDDKEPDSICVFQLFTDDQAFKRFLEGEWYPEYLKEIEEVVAEAPQIQPASLIWQKPQ